MICRKDASSRSRPFAAVGAALVVVLLAAGAPAQAGDEVARQQAGSDLGLAVGQLYNDPLLDRAESLDEILGFASGAPTVAITMSKSTYASGDLIHATEFTLKNPNDYQVAVEVKVWLSIPGQSSISILNIGANGSMSFPANFNSKLGPLVLFAVTSSTTKGTWKFCSRVLDPKTGELFSEDINEFVVE